MKRIAYIFALCAAALVSCSKPELETGDAMAPGLNISLRMAGPATKAGSTMPGVAELNENKIESIAYFVFDGRDDSAALINKGTKTVGVDVTSAGVSVNLALSEEAFDAVTYDSSKFCMYLIANATEAFSGLTTVAQIKDKLLTLAKTEGKQDSFVMYGVADSFQMLDPVKDKRRAKVVFDIKRVLAKVSFKVTVDKIFEKAINTDGTELEEGQSSDVKVRWTSNPAEVKVKFSGLASQAKIAPAVAFKPVLFDIDYKTYTPKVVEANPSYDCITDIPYYTYPRTWTIADSDQPYFLISVPWTSELVGMEKADWFQPTTATTYYKVILGGTFASNNWYAISVALKGLGSLTPGSAVEISPLDLTVADWKDSVEGETRFHTEAQFQDARVLDVPQDEIILYNTTDASVPYITTNNCVISNVKLEMFDYSKEQIPQNPTTYLNESPNLSSVRISHSTIASLPNNDAVFELTKDRIHFSHALTNDFTASVFDYRDYIYTITICHADAVHYSETLVIRQKPALNIMGVRDSNNSDKNPNTFINSYTSSNQSSGDNYKLVALSSGNNHNPNMYVVSVSQITSGGAKIGDPRKLTVDNLSSSWAKQGNDIAGGAKRTITSYYPTDSFDDVIAPKFRIASSYGKNSGAVSMSSAKERCASFQEDGYPAGRWRIPTKAEVEFILSISGKGCIPALFTNGSKYWCATGIISPVAGGNPTYNASYSSSSTAFIRCVYDEWYWENTDYPRMTSGLNTFTWGDMPR